MGRGASIEQIRRIQQLGGARRYTESKDVMLNTLSRMQTDMLQLESKDYHYYPKPDGTSLVTNYTEASGPSGSPETQPISYATDADVIIWQKIRSMLQYEPTACGYYG